MSENRKNDSGQSQKRLRPSRTIKRDTFSFDATVDAQHLDASISLNTWEDSRLPFSALQIIRFRASISPQAKLKWLNLIVDVYCIPNLLQAREPLDHVGYVEGLQKVLHIQAFWPTETFTTIAALVANSRIDNLSVDMTPLKYRFAELQGLYVSTRTKKASEEDFKLVHGQDSRRATISKAQQTA